MKLLTTCSSLPRLLTAFCLTATLFLCGQARAGLPSGPPQLDSLVLESGSGLVGFTALPLSPSFNSSTLDYAASIPFEHSAVDIVVAGSSNPFHDVQVSLPSSFPAGQTTPIVITVADDPFLPTQTTTYTVNVTRGAPNVTASLANLIVAGFPITPAFDPLTFSYATTVGFGTAAVSITPTAADAGSTITVNGNPAPSATPTPDIPLSLGTNQIVILVTSADETVTKGYEIIVTRLEQDSDNDKMEDFWEFQNGLEIGFNDGLLDKDSDGLRNLFEYAFGSDPCDPTDAARPQITINGSGFAELSFFKAVTDGSLIYTPEVADPGASPAWSNDFTDLTPGGSPQNQLWRDNAGGAPTAPAQRWIRVRIDCPAP